MKILSGSGTDSDIKQKWSKALPLGESMTSEAHPIASGVVGQFTSKQTNVDVTGFNAEEFMSQLHELTSNKEFEPFRPYVDVDVENKAVSIFLRDCSYYGEWIEGEGWDICLYKDNYTNEVVGARLPLKTWDGKLSVNII